MSKHQTALRLTRVLALVVGLSLPLAGCGKGEPAYTGDPAGVNRAATPQIIVKKDDIYIDGHLIRQYKTSSAEVKAWTGFSPSVQEEADAFWDQTGITIFAAPQDHLAGKPVLVHSVRVWLRHDDMPALKKIDRECTDAEIKQHAEWVDMRLKSIEADDLRFSKSSDAQKAEIRAETCSRPAERPLHLFSGYLEVDGLPLTANMSLHEIQARRKQLGLPPLYNRVIGGPLMYNAPRKANEPDFYQVWYFEYVPQPGKSIDEQKMLRMVDL